MSALSRLFLSVTKRVLTLLDIPGREARAFRRGRDEERSRAAAAAMGLRDEASRARTAQEAIGLHRGASVLEQLAKEGG